MQLPLKTKHLLFASILFFCSCATKYHPINFSDVNFGTKSEKSEVELYYRYDIMSSSKNPRQANKELRKDMKVVALKIVNNTSQEITIGENAKFYADGKELALMPANEMNRQLKQGVIPYAGYLLLSPIKFSYDKDNGKKTVEIFGGAVIGTALAAGNIYIASKANKALKKDLEKYSLVKKNILPGETIYGLITLQQTGYVPLQLKLVK